MFDNSTVEYLRDVMVPGKQFQYKPDMAFGLFLGYSLKIDPPVTDPALYRSAAEEQLKQDVESVKSYIADTMKRHNLEGYTFYCYVHRSMMRRMKKQVLLMKCWRAADEICS